MTEKVQAWEMSLLHYLGSFWHILNCLLLLLIQKEILCCPTACHQCIGRQADCRNSGLSSIPNNFSQNTIFVYLSGNNLSQINPDELIGLKQVVVLHLDKSGIFHVYPKAFSAFKKLWYLHLNNNHIKYLDPETFDGLSNLRSLHLQDNEIAFVARGIFRDLASVKYLMLQSNCLSILSSRTFFGMISLRILNLKNNKISWISHAAFHHLGNLTHLFLEGNSLTYVPSNAFVALNSLERLSLSYNSIGSIPSFAFNGLEKLKYLSLKSANIKAINVNGFSGLNNLRKLVLSNNNLENINSNTFALLDNLMFLHLDRNKIISIADNAFEKVGSSLKILNLAFNNLTELQPEVLQPLVSLNQLQANYNPWNCTCGLCGLINWISSIFKSINFHCQNPSNLRGRHLNYAKLYLCTNCFVSTKTSEIFKNPEPTSVHDNAATSLMTCHKNSTNNIVHQQLKNVDTNTYTLWLEKPTTAATQEYTSKNLKQVATVSVQIPIQHVPVNLTMEEDRESPPKSASVSFKTSVMCTQQLKKLHQAFDILLTFFILTCAAIFCLIYKIVQYRQKLKAQKNSDNAIEYYSFYQAGSYSITDPSQTHLGSSELDHAQLSKSTALQPQAQVILFEHSAL